MKTRMMGLVLLAVMNITSANASDQLGKVVHNGTIHENIKRLKITGSPGCSDVKFVMERSAGDIFIMSWISNLIGNDGLSINRFQSPVQNIGSDNKTSLRIKAVTEIGSVVVDAYLEGCGQKSKVEQFLVGQMPDKDISFIINTELSEISAENDENSKDQK